MKTLYLECAMGAAGDMLMAALSELLPDRQAFVDKMNALGIPGVRVEAEPAVKCGVTGTHMAVTVRGEEETSEDVPDGGHEHEHHHDHDHDHEHHHDHEHGENCTCGCHDHDHHHHHHADEVFNTFGIETAHKFDRDLLEKTLKSFAEDEEYEDVVIRAKGIVECTDGKWAYFDMVPGSYEIREGEPDYTGRLVVIGTTVNEEQVRAMLGM